MTTDLLMLLCVDPLSRKCRPNPRDLGINYKKGCFVSIAVLAHFTMKGVWTLKTNREWATNKKMEHKEEYNHTEDIKNRTGIHSERKGNATIGDQASNSLCPR